MVTDRYERYIRIHQHSSTYQCAMDAAFYAHDIVVLFYSGTHDAK